MVTYAWVLAALQSLAVYHEDRTEPHKPAQEALIADAIAGVARDKHEAALLLTVGNHETNFSYRIHTGRCQPLECDRGRARGPFQAHLNSRDREEWLSFGTLSGTYAATQAAVTDLRRARGLCRGEPDEVLATLRAYGGRGCRGRLKDEEKRLATYRRLVGR